MNTLKLLILPLLLSAFSAYSMENEDEAIAAVMQEQEYETGEGKTDWSAIPSRQDEQYPSKMHPKDNRYAAENKGLRELLNHAKTLKYPNVYSFLCLGCNKKIEQFKPWYKRDSFYKFGLGFALGSGLTFCLVKLLSKSSLRSLIGQ